MNIKFISFEGIDASGKTTQAKLLFNLLKNKQFKVVLTREPGGTKLSEKIREILIDENNRMDGETELLLHFASRRDHIKNFIIPHLQKDYIVICDRFTDSTFAYQGYGYNINSSLIETLNKKFINISPDITFLLDIENSQLNSRTINRVDNNKYEKMNISFFNRVRNGFSELQKNNKRIHKIESKNSILDIHNEILFILERKKFKM